MLYECVKRALQYAEISFCECESVQLPSGTELYQGFKVLMHSFSSLLYIEVSENLDIWNLDTGMFLHCVHADSPESMLFELGLYLAK